MSAMSWSLDPALFAKVFALIFVAELPDKTFFATIALSARRSPYAVFLGVAAAFAVQSLVAVAFGGVFALLSPRVVKVGVALLFFAFAWMMWREEDEAEEARAAQARGESFARAALTAFSVIFAAEWGDLTQLATAALQAEHRAPLTIFLAATSALWCVTALGVAAGRALSGRLDPGHLRKAAAVVFAAAGVVTLLR